MAQGSLIKFLLRHRRFRRAVDASRHFMALKPAGQPLYAPRESVIAQPGLK